MIETLQALVVAPPFIKQIGGGFVVLGKFWSIEKSYQVIFYYIK
jgi:hypothetical protein